MTNTQLLTTVVEKKAKVLYFDIETSPVLAWTYPMFDVNIPAENIEKDMQITSIAWQFEGEKSPSYLEWGVKRDDREMLVKFSKILNSADIVIGQNSDAFDIKIIQWRLNVLGLPPIQKLTSLDTLKLSRKSYRPSSHKLDYRSRVYGLGGKLHQSMADCIAVAKGNREAQRRRIEYNIKDVVDLRKIFWRELRTYVLPVTIVKFLKSFISNNSPEYCIKCDVNQKGKFNIEKNGKRRECNNCGYEWRIKNK